MDDIKIPSINIEPEVKAVGNFIGFVKQAFCENGVPSSSRLISAWLSVSSMALIWFAVRHAMSQPPDKLMTWLGNLPAIIYALGAFTVAPYGVGKIGSTIASFRKDRPDGPEDGK